MHAICHSIRCNKSIDKREPCFCRYSKQLHALSQLLLISLSDMIFRLTELHLTKMNDTVGTLDDQIYLGTSLPLTRHLAPRRNFRCHPRYSKCSLNGICMHQAHDFKSQALPRRYQSRLKVVTPPLFIARCILCNEPIVKQGVEIYQSIIRLPCLASEVVTSGDKVTSLQIRQHSRKRTTIHPNSLDNLRPRHSSMMICQGLYHIDI